MQEDQIILKFTVYFSELLAKHQHTLKRYSLSQDKMDILLNFFQPSHNLYSKKKIQMYGLKNNNSI